MERDKSIDIAKTLGIALVVLGHVQGYGESTGLLHLRNFIYQFHVPLFFFLSGFFFNETESWKTFSIKKIKRLYVPCFVWNMVFLAISVLAHRFNGEVISFDYIVKHCIRITLGLKFIRACGATWFLITLLEALFLYKLLVTLSDKLGIRSSLFILFSALILGIVGILIRLPFGIERPLVALFFVCSGHLTKKHHILDYLGEKKKAPLMISGFLTVLLFSTLNNPDMVVHEYGNIPIYFISSLIGIFSTIILSSLIAKIGSMSFLAQWGSMTIWILIWHFIAFKTVTLLQIGLYGKPWNVLLSFPCYNVGSFWPFLYFMAGFFLPIVAASVYRSKFCNKWQGSLS